MKKTIFALIILCAMNGMAQNEVLIQEVLVNKKGTPILPAAGDWGIGISASPFLEYSGNIFTSAYNYAPVFSSAHPGYIYGKYYLSDNTAVRANLQIGMTSNTHKTVNFTDNTQFDKSTVSALNIGIAAGIEKYKTIKSRLRGYYGADVILAKTPYYGPRYGGTMNVEGKYSYTDGVDANLDYVEKGGNTFELGVQGVIGIEYFFAPKMSVSSEFGLVFYGSMTGKRKYVPENGDEVVFNPGGSAFGLNTNTSSLINLFFYF